MPGKIPQVLLVNDNLKRSRQVPPVLDGGNTLTTRANVASLRRLFNERGMGIH